MASTLNEAFHQGGHSWGLIAAAERSELFNVQSSQKHRGVLCFQCRHKAVIDRIEGVCFDRPELPDEVKAVCHKRSQTQEVVVILCAPSDPLTTRTADAVSATPVKIRSRTL
jgi:hypothetical protein